MDTLADEEVEAPPVVDGETAVTAVGVALLFAMGVPLSWQILTPYAIAAPRSVLLQLATEQA